MAMHVTLFVPKYQLSWTPTCRILILASDSHQWGSKCTKTDRWHVWSPEIHFLCLYHAVCSNQSVTCIVCCGRGTALATPCVSDRIRPIALLARPSRVSQQPEARYFFFEMICVSLKFSWNSTDPSCQCCRQKWGAMVELICLNRHRTHCPTRYTIQWEVWNVNIDLSWK